MRLHRFWLAAVAAAATSISTAVATSEVDVEVDEKKHEAHIIDSLDLLLYVCLLILTIVTIWVFKQRRVRFLHESGLAILYGLIVGALLR